ncbi:hypothetical protein B0D71_19440 [Pseudomonas laurylsulfativorans]|uniref:Uncharacterized protein n=1 Tax=Pseudomonas laurylsulfativorans TaxID=1943631 RepID=A0A2S3VLX3_9PSED|nr:hypothetical protein B0D71_19440 [Pseudomonas laurylsulfativorans]
MDDNDNAGSLIHLGALRFFASRLAPTGMHASPRQPAGEERGCAPICCCPSVGASLLAMDDNDNAGSLIYLGALRFFASRLAPTGMCASPRMNTSTQPAGEERGLRADLLLLLCRSEPARDGRQR